MLLNIQGDEIMTDEEKAIDYICNDYYEATRKGFTDKEKSILREEIKENDKNKIKLYLAGLAEGRKEVIEWHDLGENPDDLPKCAENKQIIFYVKEFYTDIGKDTSHFCLGFYAKSFMNDDVMVFVERSKGYECEHLSQEVIKWSELPQFKE